MLRFDGFISLAEVMKSGVAGVALCGCGVFDDMVDLFVGRGGWGLRKVMRVEGAGVNVGLEECLWTQGDKDI